MIAELILHAHVPEWTALLGWSLLFTNLLSLPVMNLSGLMLEDAPAKDFVGVLGALATSFLLVPFQAYAAIKGFIERNEGPWYRTPKTGRITDPVQRLRRLDWLRRWLFGPGPTRVRTAPTVHATSSPTPPRPARRLGWVAVAALISALSMLGFGALRAPVVEAAGNPLFLHGSGAAPGCTPTTMDPTTGPRAVDVECEVFAANDPGTTSIWTYANLPSQTISAGPWSFTMYWEDGTASSSSTVTVSVGAVSGPSCAAFVATIPNPGTWTTAFGLASGASTTSPTVVSTSAFQAALTIPPGGSLCLRVLVEHNAGGGTHVNMIYDGTGLPNPVVAPTNLLPPSTVVPESVLGLVGIALAIPALARRRLLTLLSVRR
jgi:hypothetical protein